MTLRTSCDSVLSYLSSEFEKHLACFVCLKDKEVFLQRYYSLLKYLKRDFQLNIIFSLCYHK